MNRDVRQALALLSSYVIVATFMLVKEGLGVLSLGQSGFSPRLFAVIAMLVAVSVSCGFFSNSLLLAPVSAMLGGLLGQLSIVLFRPGVTEYLWAPLPASSPSGILMIRMFLLAVGALGSMLFWLLTPSLTRQEERWRASVPVNHSLKSNDGEEIKLHNYDPDLIEEPLRPIVGVLREAGLDIWIRPEIEGRSRASHSFTIVARDEEGVNLAIDVKAGARPVDKEEALLLWGKAADTGINRPLLIAVPGLTEPAEKIAINAGIIVISSRTIQEAAELLREKLGRIMEENRREAKRREIETLEEVLKKIEG